jgi:hypothetical protein
MGQTLVVTLPQIILAGLVLYEISVIEFTLYEINLRRGGKEI